MVRSGHNNLKLVKVDFGEITANVFGVAIVNVLPSGFHAVNFGL